MNGVKNILDFLNKNPNNSKDNTPEDFCPNCWGRQEYGGHFYKAVKSLSFKDLEQKKSWITSYVEHNLKGIHLKHKDGKQVCNVCFETCKN